jgi:hypothetical protein
LTLLEKYVDALSKGDAEMISSLFAKECYFNDGGGRLTGKPDLTANNRESVREIFAAIFQRAKFVVEIKRLNQHSMEYDVINGDVVNPCVGLVTEKDGLITEYIVRPR